MKDDRKNLHLTYRTNLVCDVVLDEECRDGICPFALEGICKTMFIDTDAGKEWVESIYQEWLQHYAEHNT